MEVGVQRSFVPREEFLGRPFGFLAFLEAKMTKIDILNPKLIVPDDYQQFWAHFECFLSLFHISDRSENATTQK